MGNRRWKPKEQTTNTSKVQTTDTSKKEKEKVDEPLTAAQILAADKKKFEVLNNKDEKQEHQQKPSNIMN